MDLILFVIQLKETRLEASENYQMKNSCPQYDLIHPSLDPKSDVLPIPLLEICLRKFSKDHDIYFSLCLKLICRFRIALKFTSYADLSAHTCTIGHGLIRINGLVQLLSVEEILQEFLDLWNTGGASDQHNIVDLSFVHFGVP